MPAPIAWAMSVLPSPVRVYIRRVEKQGDRLANIEFETMPQVKNPWKELNPAK